MWYRGHAILGNGVRTDHPVPGLPFVDDRSLPLGDPAAIEALGRHQGANRWGRFDRQGEGWKAFTTDPDEPALAWVVLWHPAHGRTVWLVHDSEASSLYDGCDTAMLIRAGGYWWDGVTWYRPSQVFDVPSETYVRREVPDAKALTARDLIPRNEGPRPSAGTPVPTSGLAESPLTLDEKTWRESLRSTWASSRPGDGLPLECCVIDVRAPELAPAALLSLPEMAAQAGLSPSTLRAYITRNENEVPTPQARVGTRSYWSAPVVQEWIERREQEPEALAQRVSSRSRFQDLELPMGIVNVWERVSETLAARLRNVGRSRLGRRLDDPTIDFLAQDLAWYAAASPDMFNTILRIDRLGMVIEKAIHWDIAREVYSDLHKNTPRDDLYPMIDRATAYMVDWMVRHHPEQAIRNLQSVVGDCERDFELSRRTLQRAIISGLRNGLTEDVDPNIIGLIDGALARE